VRKDSVGQPVVGFVGLFGWIGCVESDLMFVCYQVQLVC
jgi:hypothetical protein